MKKYIFLLLIAGLFMAFQPSEQTSLGRLKAQLEKYQAKRPIEKLFFHLDRPAYHVGDTIWASGYLLNVENKLWDLSKIIHIQLENQDGKPVKQWQLAADRWKAYGALVIPADLPAGLYRFSAFTQWMRNRGTEGFYSTFLPIYDNENKTSFSPRYAGPQLTYAPEGGKLVRQLLSRLALQAMDAEGKPLNSLIKLVDGNGTVIESVQPDAAGQAYAEFTPEFGHNYYLSMEGEEKLIPITDIQAHGTVLRVNSDAQDELTVLVQSNEPMRDAASRQGLLVVYAKGQILYAADCVIGRGRFVANFPKRDLLEGVVEVLVFDGNLKLVAQRCIFHQIESYDFAITLDQSAYASREKIKLKLTSDSDLSRGRYSLSVRRLHPAASESASIHPFSFSEIKTDFIPSQLKESAAIDMWLMGKKSNTPWDDIVSDEFPRPEFLVQQQPILRGKVWRNVEPAPACSLDAFIGEHHYLYEITTDEHGEFDLPIVDFPNEATLFFVPEDLDDRLQVVLDRQMGEAFQVYNKSMTPMARSFWDQQAIRQEAAHDYHVADQRQENRNQLFYRKADLIVRPDDYIPLPSMIEVFREIVPTVQVKGNAGNFRLRVVPEGNIVSYEEAPLLLIDGFPTYDPRRLLSLSPDEVDRIEVLHMYATLKRLGRIGLYGAIAVYTRSGDFDAGRQELIFQQFPGVQQTADFVTPSYPSTQKSQSKEPDFRATAYWNPNIDMNDQQEIDFSFYLGDDVGKYEIELQGISASGQAVLVRRVFDVEL